MKKVVIIFLLLVMLLLATNVKAAGSNSVVIQVKNPLPVPVTKVITFSSEIKGLSATTKFALFYKEKKLPLQIVERKANMVGVKTVVSLLPNETKLIVLKYGNNIKNTDSNFIFEPNFSGTYFVGIGSGKLYISSLADNNDISVKFRGDENSISFKLNKDECKTISLNGRDVVFSVSSTFPVFAEVSSLKDNCLEASSDDMSSVYGTYFVLYIPREIIVSAYNTYSDSATKLKIVSLSGKTVFDGSIPERGQYKNLNLSPGFYKIFASHPVTVQFGCEDDNVYAINYGSLNALKGVSYGNIVCPALFSDTVVKIKTPSNQYTEMKLEKSGDYIYKDLITEFKDNQSEMISVYVEYSKPVLVYSDSNHGNIGGEQIPSIEGNGKKFIFLTGKIFNFNGIIHKRKIAIIPSESDTHITINGKQITLENAMVPKYLLFDKSYSLINLTSDKPVSVFDVGMDTALEYFTMLLPIKDHSVICNIMSATSSSGSGQINSPETLSKNVFIALNKFLSPVGAFFQNSWKSVQNSSWFKNVQNSINEFLKDITPSLQSLSKKIIALFMPVSAMIYPYIHSYIPSLTQSELAAIIFYILIAFIIILLWPKHRGNRKSVPVVKLKEADLEKKKKLAFNVKTIEEKGPTGIKYGAKGKPKTILPAKKTAENLEAVKNNKPETGNVGVSYPKKPTTATQKVKHTESIDLHRKTIPSVLNNQAGQPVPVKEEGSETQKKVLEVKKKEAPVKPAENALHPEGENLLPTTGKKQSEEKKILQKTIPEEKVKNTLTQEEKQKVEVVSDKRNVFSRFLHKKETAEKKKELKKIVSPVEKTAEAEKDKPAAQSNNVPPLSKPVKEEKETPVQKEERKEKIIKQKTEAERLVSKTSLDELLERVKKEMKTEMQTPSKLKQEAKEEHEEKEPALEIAVKLESSVVMDKNSAKQIVYTGLIKRFNRTFISAREQPDIDAESRSKYRIGVIALTPIELRIAEDLARRIGAKQSTGEVLLIAKKVGVKQIIVDDKPKITNYQGIRITNIRDIIKK
jgi:hypothetical protein